MALLHLLAIAPLVLLLAYSSLHLNHGLFAFLLVFPHFWPWMPSGPLLGIGPAGNPGLLVVKKNADVPLSYFPLFGFSLRCCHPVDCVFVPRSERILDVWNYCLETWIVDRYLLCVMIHGGAFPVNGLKGPFVSKSHIDSPNPVASQSHVDLKTFVD